MLIQTFTESDLEQGIRYGEQGLHIAREHDLLEVKAFLEHDLARPYMRLGRLSDAWAAYESSQTYWREVGNLPMLADNLASLSESYYNAGEFDKSLQYAGEGLRISEEAGNVWGKAYNNIVIGPILAERGEVDESLLALNSTLDLSKQSNFAAGVVATQMIQSWLYAMLGDQEKASQFEPLIKEFVEQYESFKPLYFLNRAQNELYSGKSDKALETIEKVGSAYTAYSELIFHPYIYTLYIEIHLANEENVLALETADGYLESMNHDQVKILMPDILNQKARALTKLERISQAYETLIEAKNLARVQNSRRSLWAVLLDLADIEKDAQSAIEMRDEARSIIAYISDHISDPGLKQKFLDLPRVRRSGV
jgi:tetratricopeptide (TPR) repeat protein